MTDRMLSLVACLFVPMLCLVLACTSGVLSAEQQPQHDRSSSQNQLSHWIAQLGSNQYAQRRAATKEIMAYGSRAIPALTTAARSPDSEVQARALSILLHHTSSTHQATRTAARQVLEQLAADADPLVARRSRNALHSLTLLAVLRLKQAGAKITFNEQQPTAVDLSNSKISDHDLQPLSLLPTVRTLQLQHTPITNAGLKHLKRLSKLEECNLQGTKITDEGLSAIAQLTNLRSFSVEHTQVTDQGLWHLRELTHLETLYLGSSQVKGPGLVSLADLPLTYLSFEGSLLTDEATRSIVHLTHLRTLGLDNTPVTDQCLPRLVALKELEVLWLDKTQVTDQGVKHIVQLGSLRTLHLRQTGISREGFERLKQALPRATINYSSSE